MSGHQPVQTINISYMNKNNANRLFFKIKDETYFSSHPDIYFKNIEDEDIYSLLPLHFKVQSTTKLDASTFEIKLSFDVENHQNYKEYNFQIAPNSGSVKGEPVSLKASVLPSLLREEEYFYNPELDIVKEVNKVNKKWIGTEINLETQLKRRHTFPKSFYQNLKLENQILDIHSLKNKIIFDETIPSGKLCEQYEDSSFLVNRNCHCSKESFYEDEEENFYMESICYYSAKFQILPSHIETNKSAYIQHDYKVKDQNLAFPSIDLIYKNKDQKKIVSINEKNYLVNEIEKKGEDEDNSWELIKNEIKEEEVNFKTFLHFFFNLQPSWKCENSSESDKKNCKIRYNINEKQIVSFSLNSHLMNSFLREQIIADTKCFHTDSMASIASNNVFNKEYKCNCKATLRFVNNNIELDCDFEADTLLKINLKTDHPHIYFFNKEDEEDKQTSVESIYIN